MRTEHLPAYTGLVSYLYCRDAAAEATWLVRVFGFELYRSYPDPSGLVRNIELRAGTGGEIWLDHKPEARDALRGLSDWIGVEVESVETLANKVRDAGIEPDALLERPWGFLELQVTDPEGYCWGFLERTVRAAARGTA